MKHCNSCKHSDGYGFKTCRCYSPAQIMNTATGIHYDMVFKDKKGKDYAVIYDKSRGCEFYEEESIGQGIGDE